MNQIEQMIQELCPNGVEFKELGDFSIQLNGMTGVSDKWKEQGNCRFIDYLNVYNNVSVDTTKLPFATVKDTAKQTVLKINDILFTSASETPDECALSATIEKDIPDGIFLDDHLFGIRIMKDWEDRVYSGYLKYLFRSNSVRREINKTVRGVTRFYISKKDFMLMRVPIPPFSIQKKIAEILDKFTELEAELEAELDCRKRQYEYYRNQLLTFANGGGGYAKRNLEENE